MKFQDIDVAGITLHWFYPNPVQTYTLDGVRGVLLLSTDLEEHLALFKVFKSSTPQIEEAIAETIKTPNSVLGWDFRLDCPYVRQVFPGE